MIAKSLLRASIVLLVLPAIILCRNETVEEEEQRVNLWLQDMDKSLVKRMYEDSEASWSYEANLTDYNYELMNNLSVTSAKFYKVCSYRWWVFIGFCLVGQKLSHMWLLFLC